MFSNCMFQHYLTMIGAIVAIPFILCPALCMSEDDPGRGYIIATMIFVTGHYLVHNMKTCFVFNKFNILTGLVTLIQTTFGCRLPIVQGGTISFLVPTLAILNLPQWHCPSAENISQEEKDKIWMVRIREISGAIAVSSLFQVFIGN